MILLVHAHPVLKSFNASLVQIAEESLKDTQVHTVDLYRIPENNGTEYKAFPPILHEKELIRKTSINPTIQKQMALVEEAEAYLIIHPDWWGGPPAILKGWLDRVLRPETAYYSHTSKGKSEIKGLLNNKKALVITTGENDTGTLRNLWVNHIWGFCGVQARLIYISGIYNKNLAERRKILSDCAETIQHFYQQPFISTS